MNDNRSLNLVLLQIDEETPTSIDKVCQRTAILGKFLSQAGHHVTWIKGVFDHHTKKYPQKIQKEILLAENYKIIQVKGIGYSKNVCIRRYIHDYLSSLQAIKGLKRLKKIDGIVCSMPSVELAYEACRYARKHGIPFLLDLRDAWPDIFTSVCPPLLRGLLKMAIVPDVLRLRYTLKHATAITSMSRDMLNWGLKKHSSARNKSTGVFYLSTTPKISLSPEQEKTYEEKYSAVLSPGKFRVFYISRWGIECHPTLLLHLAEKTKTDQHGKQINFIICGDGDYGPQIRAQAKKLDNVFLPGFIPPEEAYFLAKHCHIGVLYLARRTNETEPFLPNKLFFLLSSKLPILNGMGGELSLLVEQHRMGFNLENNNMDSMEEKILYLMKHEDERQAMSHNVEEFFKTRADPEIVYRDFVNFIEKTIS
jgi:glycosyltransferase involved in cell wall biosynthesis